MTKAISFDIKALQPLVITKGTSEGQTHQSLDYIPGNMLLGTLAYAFKDTYHIVDADSDENFKNLFLKRKVLFGHANPLAGDVETTPIPLCYQKIKNHDGLPTVGCKKADKSCVINFSALEDNPETADDSLSEKIKKDEVAKHWPINNKEAIKFKKLDAGFMTEQELCMPDVNKSWAMHVAIDKNRTAAESQLFGYSSINIGTTFRCEIYCDDDVFNTLNEFLDKLIAANTPLFVGHSRSAGYGKIAISNKKEGDATLKHDLKAESNLLYFSSSFVPTLSWLSPLESLEQELSKYFDNLEITKLSCLFDNMPTFNNQWQLPRRSRDVLLQGSVIHFKGTKKANVDLPTTLGGFANEGYGRYMLNPEFLELPFLKPTDIEAPLALENEKVSELEMSDLVKVIRARSISRLAKEAALKFTSRQVIKDFTEKRRGGATVSPSQLGNLRIMISSTDNKQWRPKFEEILTKTPGKQWKNAEAKSPFDEAQHYDSLDNIMLSFLDKEEFLKKFSTDEHGNNLLQLIGKDKPTADEQKAFENQYYRLCLLNLLKNWDMKDKQNKASRG